MPGAWNYFSVNRQVCFRSKLFSVNATTCQNFCKSVGWEFTNLKELSSIFHKQITLLPTLTEFGTAITHYEPTPVPISQKVFSTEQLYLKQTVLVQHPTEGALGHLFQVIYWKNDGEKSYDNAGQLWTTKGKGFEASSWKPVVVGSNRGSGLFYSFLTEVPSVRSL